MNNFKLILLIFFGKDLFNDKPATIAIRILSIIALSALSLLLSAYPLAYLFIAIAIIISFTYAQKKQQNQHAQSAAFNILMPHTHLHHLHHLRRLPLSPLTVWGYLNIIVLLILPQVIIFVAILMLLIFDSGIEIVMVFSAIITAFWLLSSLFLLNLGRRIWLLLPVLLPLGTLIIIFSFNGIFSAILAYILLLLALQTWGYLRFKRVEEIA